MNTKPGPVAETSPRTDSHNVEIDETLAAQHLYGTLHLETGTRCTLPERHSGGCDFAAPLPLINRSMS